MPDGKYPLNDDGRAVVPTMEEAGQFLGVGGRQIQNWIAKGCPGEKGRYVPAEMIEWARTRGPWKPPVVDPDPLMNGTGGDSKWLERYRREKTLAARQDRRAKAGELVRLSEFLSDMLELAGNIRAAGDRLARDYGADAQAVVNEAADEFAAGIRRRLGDGDGGAS